MAGGIRKIETTIGGDTWSTNTLPAFKGLAVTTRIAAILGAAGGVLGASGTDENELVGRAISALTARLDEPKTIETVKTLCAELRKNSKPISFDLEFSGNYGTLVRIIAWLIKENFESFLDAKDQFATWGQAVMQSIPAKSTGESEGS